MGWPFLESEQEKGWGVPAAVSHPENASCPSSLAWETCGWSNALESELEEALILLVLVLSFQGLRVDLEKLPG